MLTVILILATRLLFRFSYDTFIPWDIGFGLFLYIVFFFYTIIGSEIYFFKRKISPLKSLTYKALPAVLNVVVIGLITYFFTFPDLSRNSDSGAAGLAILFFIVIWLSVTTTFFVILTLLRSDAPYDPIYKPDRYKRYLSLVRPFGNLIRNTALITIPILIASISYIGVLAHSDYLAGGIEYSYTDKSNARLMFKKSQDNLDISFCDHIKGDRGNKLKSYCYQSFFEGISEIKQFEDRNKNIPLTANFFKIYNKNKNKHCSHLKEPDLCENVLLKVTYKILELNTEALFKYASVFVEKSDDIPQYLIITNHNTKAYESINLSVVIEVQKYLSHSSAMFKNNMPDGNKDTTIIHLDIKNLAGHEKNLIEFSRKIIEIRKALLSKYEKEREAKKKVANEKMRIENMKWDKAFRKKYKLDPNDPIIREPCPAESNKYTLSSVDICINGIKIPHAGSKASLISRDFK